MSNSKFTIIADSCCDLFPNEYESEKINFITIPIDICIEDKVFIDDDKLDTNDLVEAMQSSKKAVKSACPSPDAFLKAMDNNDNIICVTLSSKLSGTHNSARLAAEMALEKNPEKNIFVLDSLSASAGIAIVLNRLAEIIESEKFQNFEDVTRQITSFCRGIKVRFILQDFGNLIKTGRIGKLAGLIASTLNIKPICGDNGEGEIKMFFRTFGTRKAFKILSEYPEEKIKQEGNGLPVVITHCHNEKDAKTLVEILKNKFNLTNIKIYLMRGISSVYASHKGLTMAF